MLPAVSNLELTNVCNFTCPYCQNQGTIYGQRKKGFIDFKLIEKLAAEKSLSNTAFLELHLDGEPTLHPEFIDIARFLKTQVPYLGTATNGTMIAKGAVTEALQYLDEITLSIHEETTQEVVDKVVDIVRHNSQAVLRIQTLNNETYGLDLVKHKEYVWLDNVTIQVFGQVYDKTVDCIDLHTCVAVEWDGDVIPCCNCLGKQYVLGNLYEQTLQEIWSSAPKKMFSYCRECLAPNPFAFRMKLIANCFEYKKKLESRKEQVL